MKDIKGLLLIAILIVIGWHIKVAFFAGTRVTGLFKEKPQEGYVWKGYLFASFTNSMTFWDAPGVQWRPGLKHSQFNVEASTLENKWVPLPGYRFLDEANLTTVWQPNQVHPRLKAISTSEEGRWVPVVGYRFIMKEGLAVDTEWDPGQQNDDLRIIAGTNQDTYIPYPGYKFINPGKDLEVAWTPGMTDPINHPNKVSGYQQDTWVEMAYSNDYSTEPSKHITNAIAGGVVGKIIEGIFGENQVSNYIYRESVKEGIKAFSNN